MREHGWRPPFRRRAKVKVGLRMAYPHDGRRQPLQNSVPGSEDILTPGGTASQPQGVRGQELGSASSPASRWVAEAPPLAARLTDPPAAWPRARYAGAKVLIVENEDSNRMLMEKILTLVGYQCVSASNGQEALEVFR